ncbi:MAG: hypothetical protein KKE20_00750 [Nanoarchaeota archaeon]|nr:hypothetical protein [Nanoarchaeota archaeon]
MTDNKDGHGQPPRAEDGSIEDYFAPLNKSIAERTGNLNDPKHNQFLEECLNGALCYIIKQVSSNIKYEPGEEKDIAKYLADHFIRFMNDKKFEGEDQAEPTGIGAYVRELQEGPEVLGYCIRKLWGEDISGKNIILRDHILNCLKTNLDEEDLSHDYSKARHERTVNPE